MSDLIRRAEAIGIVEAAISDEHISARASLYMARAELSALPSAELVLQTPQTYGKSINPSNAEVVADYISRADAIEAVLTYFIPRSHTGERGEHEEDFVRTIFKSLPSAEADWIPCSERLPNVGEDVLFCDSKWTEEGCLRVDGDWWQFRWSTIIPKVEVIAWMPLPKPYREDGEA